MGVNWDGFGAPPVGAVCEVKSTARGKERDWFKAQVKYISPFTVVLYDFPIGELEGEFVVHPNTVQFRPIKTKEQLALEERERSVIEIGTILLNGRGSCKEHPLAGLICKEYYLAGLIHDAGYRRSSHEH